MTKLLGFIITKTLGVVFFLLWCFGALKHRVNVWLFSRTPLWLVQGFPAVFVAGACLTVVVSYGYGPRVHVLDRYNAAIEAALFREDYDTAELFLHKLLAMGDSRTDARFRLALLSERAGERDAAKGMMLELAPDNGAGHAGAHFWRAKEIIASQKDLPPDKVKLLMHHLQMSLSHPPSSTEARAILAQISIAQGKLAAAETHLTAIADRDPQWRLLLARTLLAQGRTATANRELGIVVEEFKKKLDGKPDDVNARMGLADAYLMLENWNRAEQVLEEGLGIPSVGARCRDALATIYIKRFDLVAAEKKLNVGTHITWLQKALQLSPNHVHALLRLAAFIGQKNEAGAMAKTAVEDALASGEAPAVLHLLLGSMAARDGKLEEARTHMEQARRLNKSAPVILNNLAWVLSQLDPPQLEEALTLVNQAIEQSPQVATMHETRGQILTKMGRWSEAIAELELVLGQLPDKAPIHTSLALAYEKIGNNDMGRRHKDLAKAALAAKAEAARKAAEEAKSSTKASAKSNAKTAPKPAATTDGKSSGNTDAKSADKSDAKSTGDTEAKPAANAETKPKPVD